MPKTEVYFPKKGRLLPYIIMYFVVMASSQSVLYSQNLQVRIDPEKEYQQIDGFGASDAWRCQFVGKNWPEDKKNRIAELLFSQEVDAEGNPKGIGLSPWRFYIGAGTTEQGAASDIENEWRRGESFIDKNGNYDWSKQQGQQWFLNKAKEAGVEKFLAFSIAALTFWSKNQKGYNSSTDGNLNLKAEHYGDYADFMVEFLHHFEEDGLPFDYLSPINEPQWDWEKATQEGTPATNKNIADLVKRLDTGIAEKDLKTKIVIPEAADLRFLYSDNDKPQRAEQIADFFGNPENAETYLGELQTVKHSVSAHSYFTTWPVDSLISVRQKLDASLQANHTDYWQSEFCILEKTDDIGGGQQRDLGMDTALYVARVIHADMTLANAQSWQWWTALTIADFKDGLIYLDTGIEDQMYDQELLKNDGKFHDSKLLWALGNYARFVRPGMRRVELSISDKRSLNEQYKNIMISAYKNETNGELVAVAINYSDKPTEVGFGDSKLAFNTQYITSKDKNLESNPVSKNKIKLEPRSIVTLVGKSID